MSKRKVKPPAKVRKAAKQRAEEKKLEQSDVDSEVSGSAGAGKFFGLAFVVVLAIAILAAAGYYLPKTGLFKGDTQPWLSYEDRIVEPEGGGAYYPYRNREVGRWVQGVQQKGIERDDLDVILRRAERWLALPDATQILEAAYHAQPGQKSLVVGYATKLRAKAQPSSAEERACRARLDRLIN